MLLLCLKTANVLLKNVTAVDLVLQKKKKLQNWNYIQIK